MSEPVDPYRKRTDEEVKAFLAAEGRRNLVAGGVLAVLFVGSLALADSCAPDPDPVPADPTNFDCMAEFDCATVPPGDEGDLQEGNP